MSIRSNLFWQNVMNWAAFTELNSRLLSADVNSLEKAVELMTFYEIIGIGLHVWSLNATQTASPTLGAYSKSMEASRKLVFN